MKQLEELRTQILNTLDLTRDIEDHEILCRIDELILSESKTTPPHCFGKRPPAPGAICFSPETGCPTGIVR